MMYNISYGFIFVKKISVKSLEKISPIIQRGFFFVFFLHFWNWFHCASLAQPNLQRVEGKILCSNVNQVWQQTDTNLTGRASSPAQWGENREPATTQQAEAPRAKRDDPLKLKWEHVTQPLHDEQWPPQEVSITKDGSEWCQQRGFSGRNT